MSELLGSLTTDCSDDPTVRIRTSARVIHNKLRADTPQVSTEKNVQNEINPVLQPKTPTSKTHTRVQWTNIEKKFFFDALNENGRDFEQISRFINMKMKRKNPADLSFKTKDHVRQLYYQLFQKASKYLRFSDDVKKLAQELYTLINFGEMKKKLIMSSEKSFLKLRELVYRGSVTIRVKGKNIKIKTPSCRALKRINQLEGNNIEDIQLPLRIDVMLRPSNLQSWTHVQKLSQNPRIKVILPLQKRLIVLLQTLQQKWRSQDLRLHEKYVVKTIHQHGKQKFRSDVVENLEEDVKYLKNQEPMIVVHPPENCRIFRPMIQLNELLSSYNLCLNSYEKRIGAKTRGEDLCGNFHVKDLLKNSSKRMRNDSASEKSACDSKKPKIEELNGITPLTVIDNKSNDSHDFEIQKKEEKNSTTEETYEHEKANGIEEKKESELPAFTIKSENLNKSKKNFINGSKTQKEYSFKPLINEDAMKKIREGWSVENVGDLTIGDLYLMFGSDSKLILEYKWNNLDVAENHSDKPLSEKNPINNKLRHLISIANLVDNPCGLASSNMFDKNFVEKEIASGCSMSSNKNYFETYLRPNLNMKPRLKAHQSKWWRHQQHSRYRLSTNMMSTDFKTAIDQKNVIRNLYQTPSSSSSKHDESKVSYNLQKYSSDEVTKILEEKIENLQQQSAGSAQVQYISESSRASIKSLLESLSLSAGIPNYDYDNLHSFRLWDQKKNESTDEIDNMSLSSLLGHLDSFYDNKHQDC